jgi:eukaryotic-like serine/threonine-protein kinase
VDQLSTQTDFEFAGFRLDTVLQVLVSPAGESILLPARAYDALRYLLERPGELVDKAALMHAVWPNTLVEENNLNQCILTLRRALGETAGERRFILTVPGRGFKFVAPVKAIPAERAPAAVEALAAPAIPDAPRAPGAPRSRFWRLAAAGVMVTALLLAGAMALMRRAGPVTVPTEFEALTDLSESASAPALSPDGKMLAFIGEGPAFLGNGRIYVKQLPHGQSVPLTKVIGPIYAPAFTFDGTHVAFTWLNNSGPDPAWATWTVPTTGGQPTQLFNNSAGLSWIGPHALLYSEVKSGIHMGIVTSTDDRLDHRDIYFPGHERGMAHLSSLSPDRQSVLVVEMDRTGDWQPCRLVPFDGSAPGRQVGPTGRCLAGAWSPDGRWMYFSVQVAGAWHLWRQRYPDGEPQQITFGPTEESGVVVTPDGHSLLTSLGLQRESIWLHDKTGERRVTSEAMAEVPWLSADARRLYFVSARGPGTPQTLWRLDIATGQQEPLLTQPNLTGYDIAPDESEVAYALNSGSERQIWLAPLDRHLAPRLLTRSGDEPQFSAGKLLFFRQLGAEENLLYRMQDDGRALQRALEQPIMDFLAVSPGGAQAAVFGVFNGKPTTAVIDLGTQQFRWSREGKWPLLWSADGHTIYLQMESPSSGNDGQSLAVTSPDGTPPQLPPPAAVAQTTLLPHSAEGFAPSADPGVYAFSRSAWLGNIYRIPLHE